MNIISAYKWTLYFLIGLIFLSITNILYSHIVLAQETTTETTVTEELEDIQPEPISENNNEEAVPSDEDPGESDQNVADILDNQITIKSRELDKYNTFYDKLYSEAQKDFEYASEVYNSQPKEVNLDNPSVDELKTIYALAFARYSLLNMKMYESREQLTDDLNLLNKSGFEHEKIKLKIDNSMKNIIQNQARLNAFKYSIDTIEDNEEMMNSYTRYLINLSQQIESDYQSAFEEMEGIIDVYLF